MAPTGSDAALDVLGNATIEGLTVWAPRGGYGVRLHGGTVTLLSMTVRGANQAAVFLAQGEATLISVHLLGGEYGLLTQSAKSVSLSALEVRGQQRAGVAIVSGPAEISGSEFIGPFGEAAIVLLHGDSRLTGNTLRNVGAIGIKVLNGSAQIERTSIASARADTRGLEGDGLYVYDSHVTLQALTISDTDGVALSLIGSTALIESSLFTATREAAVFADRSSQLTARHSEIRDSPAGLLLEAGNQTTKAGFTFTRVLNPLVPLPP